jgi:phage terminase Nu1 subunit (DNA packaging protein)
VSKTINKRELAEFLGVSERALTRWQKEGMPVRVAGARGEGNEYDSAAVVRWLLERKEGTRKTSPRDRVAERQAELLALQIAEKTGELVPRAEIRPAWLDLIASAKQALRAMPASLAPLLAQLGDADAMRDLLDDVIEETLSKLAADDEFETQPGDAAIDARSARPVGATASNAAIRVGRETPPTAGRVSNPGAVSLRPDAVPAGDR